MSGRIHSEPTGSSSSSAIALRRMYFRRDLQKERPARVVRNDSGRALGVSNGRGGGSGRGSSSCKAIVVIISQLLALLAGL
jgi:hypothetical protein